MKWADVYKQPSFGNKKISTLVGLILLSLFNYGCGGSGGGSDAAPPAEDDTAQYFSQTKSERLENIKITGTETEVSEADASLLLSVLYDFVDFGKKYFIDFSVQDTWDPELLEFVQGEQLCERSGKKSVAYDKTTKQLTVVFSDCNDVDKYLVSSSDFIENGAERITWTDDDDYRLIEIEYDSYHVQGEADGSHLDGVIVIAINLSISMIDYIKIDLAVTDNDLGKIVVNDFIVDLEDDETLLNYFQRLSSVTGKLAALNGVFNLTSSLSPRHPYTRTRISVNGITEAKANIDYEGYQYNVFGYDANGDGYNDHSTYFYLNDSYEHIDFSGNNLPEPMVFSTFFWSGGIIGEPLLTETQGFYVLSNFTDENGSLLNYEILLERVDGRGEGSIEGNITGDPIVDYSIEQPEAGYFELISNTPIDRAIYTFQVVAKDSSGLYSSDPISIAIPVYRDTDGDGIYDISDNDDDNDDVPDYMDDFPKDANESVDTDLDGIGDNADEDDDNDGYSDNVDVKPLDLLCGQASDVFIDQCIQRVIIGASYFLDKNGVLYFWRYDSTEIFRWDAGTAHFIEPLNLKPEDFVGEDWSASIVYSKQQHSLYVTYNNAVVTRIDLDNVILNEERYLELEEISSVPTGIYDSASNWIVLVERDGLTNTFYSVNRDAELVDTYVETRGDNYAGSFYRYADVIPFCTYGFSINNSTGEFFDIGVGSLFDCACGRNIQGTGNQPYISIDGERAITRFDGIIDQSQNTVANPPINVSYWSVQWSGDGLFYLDRTLYEGTIFHYTRDGDYVDQMTLSYGDLRSSIIGEGDYLLVVREENNYITIQNFAPDD